MIHVVINRMPYIADSKRAKIDEQLELLAETIREEGYQSDLEMAALAGMLNYTITRLILSIIPGRKYWIIATVTGVLQNVSDEFYRRYVVPYEDEQLKKNGDVF